MYLYNIGKSININVNCYWEIRLWVYIYTHTYICMYFNLFHSIYYFSKKNSIKRRKINQEIQQYWIVKQIDALFNLYADNSIIIKLCHLIFHQLKNSTIWHFFKDPLKKKIFNQLQLKLNLIWIEAKWDLGMNLLNMHFPSLSIIYFW